MLNSLAHNLKLMEVERSTTITISQHYMLDQKSSHLISYRKDNIRQWLSGKVQRRGIQRDRATRHVSEITKTKRL